MAKYYEAQVQWQDGSSTQARCVGNNAAWVCQCGEVLLGPHESMYSIDPCPGCQKAFRIVRGSKPQYVDRVEEYKSTVIE